jgi:uncharacterized damage-inducible protein DinB
MSSTVGKGLPHLRRFLAMKKLLLTMFLAAATLSAQTAKPQPPSTLKGVLLEQLRTTHNVKDWFVPANTAVEGLTAEQAKWSDGKGNHSVGQLTYHLVFWNKSELAKFKGEKPPAFSGNNDETFNNFNAEQWSALVRDLDQVMTDWEKAVEAADDKKIAESASLIAHVGAHNAYHIGQIIFVRKEQGSWDPEKGVK